MEWVYDDGGRAGAGYKGDAGDCVTRAIAIATGLPYQQVYDGLRAGITDYAERRRGQLAKRLRRGASPRNGVHREIYQPYLESLGWRWVPTMRIGSGCKVHLADGELPPGRLIVAVSKHLCAVIDGVVRDTHDPRRATIICEGGVQRIAQRCVYGFFVKA